LSFGCRGKAVEQLQRSLGVLVDGRYGLSTKRRVAKLQLGAGLPVTGAVAAVEIAKLELFPLSQKVRDDLLRKQINRVIWDDLSFGF
jgi:hypothetical protein